MHMAFYMLRTTSACEQLTRTDVLATMIGAVAHDIDHPGRNNAFEIATQVCAWGRDGSATSMCDCQALIHRFVRASHESINSRVDD